MIYNAVQALKGKLKGKLLPDTSAELTITLAKKEAGIMQGLHASQKETLSTGTPASENSIADILMNVNEPKGKLVVAVPFSCNNQTTKNITQD